MVLGDLKGIRNRARGRRMNRIVSNMPYYCLTQMIIYKSLWENISKSAKRILLRLAIDVELKEKDRFKVSSSALIADLNIMQI